MSFFVDLFSIIRKAYNDIENTFRMIPLYTQEVFSLARSVDKLPFACTVCSKTFYKQKRVILRPNYSHKYCSAKCQGVDSYVSIAVTCKQCNTQFSKMPFNYKKSPNHFCSKSCAATYNNAHKEVGTRRSKLEVWLEEKLADIYPQLEIKYCDKSTVGSELDIYIPSLKLGIELNGIYHYEPIHGTDKLTQVQNNDTRKLAACHKRGVSLCIVDTSGLKYFKEDNCLPYLNIITSIIEKASS